MNGCFWYLPTTFYGNQRFQPLIYISFWGTCLKFWNFLFVTSSGVYIFPHQHQDMWLQGSVRWIGPRCAFGGLRGRVIFLEFDSYYQGRIHIMDILFCMISAYFVYKYYISFHLQSYNSRGLEKILSWLLVWGDAPGAPTCGFIKYGSSLADHPSFSTGNCRVFFSQSRPSQSALFKVVKLHHYVFGFWCVCNALA